MLEKLLNADGGGYSGAHTQCSKGHRAEFIEYRDKQLLTALSAVAVKRAYYHCEQCQVGVIPKDQQPRRCRHLVQSECASHDGPSRWQGALRGGAPRLRRFGRGRVKTKAVERVAQAIGKQIETVFQPEGELALSGKVVPLKAVPKIYIAIDGTGIPMVARETEGRKGKDQIGKGKTREVKLGCVFTQTELDDHQRPVRDEQGKTYVGAIRKR